MEFFLFRFLSSSTFSSWPGYFIAIYNTLVENFIWTKFFIAGAEEERHFLSFIIISVPLSLSFEIDSTWSWNVTVLFLLAFKQLNKFWGSFFITWTWTRFWGHNKVIRVVIFPSVKKSPGRNSNPEPCFNCQWYSNKTILDKSGYHISLRELFGNDSWSVIWNSWTK